MTEPKKNKSLCIKAKATTATATDASFAVFIAAPFVLLMCLPFFCCNFLCGAYQKSNNIRMAIKFDEYCEDAKIYAKWKERKRINEHSTAQRTKQGTANAHSLSLRVSSYSKQIFRMPSSTIHVTPTVAFSFSCTTLLVHHLLAKSTLKCHAHALLFCSVAEHQSHIESNDNKTDRNIYMLMVCYALRSPAMPLALQCTALRDVAFRFHIARVHCNCRFEFSDMQFQCANFRFFLHKSFANGSLFTLAIFLSPGILIVCKHIFINWVESICTLGENWHCSMQWRNASPFKCVWSQLIYQQSPKNYACLQREHWIIRCDERFIVSDIWNEWAKHQIIMSHYPAVCDSKLWFVVPFLSFPLAIFVVW